MNPDRHLRLWPGVIVVTLQWLVWFILPIFAHDTMLYAFLGGVAGGALILIWWLFFSRAPWMERLGVLMLMAVAMPATRRIVDPSIRTGAMGFLFAMLAIPTLSLALVAWAVITRRLAPGPRRVALVAMIVAGCGVWALLRTEGLTGEGHPQLAWRWMKTSEQKLLAEPVALAAPPLVKETIEPAPKPAPAIVPAVLPTIRKVPQPGADWPGFRGPHRDDVVTGVRIRTDWAASPPVEMWRKPVGPGWSSFAVHDGLIYTQEQRGEFEVVACYSLLTGEPVWTHRDAARFWESNGGPGPRGTPEYHNGLVYTFGATGIVNALDARNGAVLWSHNAAADAGSKTPEWGFASSPLIVDDLAIVAASGRLAAYGIEKGDLRWLGPEGGGVSYSSPHPMTVDGVAQVLLLSDIGLTSVAPADGAVLWKHSWKGYPIVQPALTGDGGVLIAVTDSSGVRRLSITRAADSWTADERWTSNGLKPYFNDFVVHKGHAYGFDGPILSCIDLTDGKRVWKGGRYGHGQMLLLADQDLLLVLSEEGEIALARAVPEQFTEIAKAPAMTDKTWNHPVLAGDILLVRNGREMVAFRLAAVK